MPTKSRFLGLCFACILAASGVVACASDGGSKNSDSSFAKSLRESDPTKKDSQQKQNAGASSGSEFKLPGRRVYIEYSDGKLNKKMALVNRAATDPSQPTPSQEEQPNTYVKVGNDDLMADLCEALRRLEFGTLADLSNPRGESPSWTLMYEVDGAKKTVSYVKGRDAETLRKLSNLQATFLYAYNRVYGLRSADANNAGKEMFKEEVKHLQTVKQEALKKTGDKP